MRLKRCEREMVRTRDFDLFNELLELGVSRPLLPPPSLWRGGSGVAGAIAHRDRGLLGIVELRCNCDMACDTCVHTLGVHNATRENGEAVRYHLPVYHLRYQDQDQ